MPPCHLPNGHMDQVGQRTGHTPHFLLVWPPLMDHPLSSHMLPHIMLVLHIHGPRTWTMIFKSYMQLKYRCGPWQDQQCGCTDEVVQ